MYSSKKICSSNVKLRSLKVHYLLAQGCMKVNSSKNDKFRYVMIGETQPNGSVNGSSIYLLLSIKKAV